MNRQGAKGLRGAAAMIHEEQYFVSSVPPW